MAPQHETARHHKHSELRGTVCAERILFQPSKQQQRDDEEQQRRHPERALRTDSSSCAHSKRCRSQLPAPHQRCVCFGLWCVRCCFVAGFALFCHCARVAAHHCMKRLARDADFLCMSPPLRRADVGLVERALCKRHARAYCCFCLARSYRFSASALAALRLRRADH